MTVALSIAVMAVPQRIAAAQNVLRQLDEEAAILRDAGVQVFYPTLSVDTALRGAAVGAADAWSHASPLATHHLVVQDDAVLCPAFLRHVLRIVALRPTACWSFQYTKLHRKPVPTVPAFVKPDRLRGALALCLPADALPGAVAALRFASARGHDDEVLHGYLRAAGRECVIAVPSLAQHGTLPSTCKHDSLASLLVSEHFPPAADTDWTTAVDIDLSR